MYLYFVEFVSLCHLACTGRCKNSCKAHHVTLNEVCADSTQECCLSKL